VSQLASPETLWTPNRSAQVKKILSDGLNERFSGGLFGHGSYLAEERGKKQSGVSPGSASAIWGWINTYENTIFSGMNIHKSRLF